MAQPTVIPTNPAAALETLRGKLLVLNATNRLLHFWKVHRWITICLLSFSKLLLYRDLDPANWPANQAITDHPLVRCLLGGTAPAADGQPGGGLPEHSIDDLPQVHDDYPLIEDADSSQHSALIDAVNGKNLVIEGPPGTGKSQTITNLIAAAMARGKRVLFKLRDLLALVARLRPGLLRYRGDWCENTALDDLLPDLETELTRLAEEKSALAERFALDPLPASDVLAGWHTTLRRRGLFRWFNRDWRTARRALLDLARPGGDDRCAGCTPTDRPGRVPRTDSVLPAPGYRHSRSAALACGRSAYHRIVRMIP